MSRIIIALRKQTGGWPRKIDSVRFTMRKIGGRRKRTAGYLSLLRKDGGLILKFTDQFGPAETRYYIIKIPQWTASLVSTGYLAAVWLIDATTREAKIWEMRTVPDKCNKTLAYRTNAVNVKWRHRIAKILILCSYLVDEWLFDIDR